MRERKKETGGSLWMQLGPRQNLAGAQHSSCPVIAIPQNPPNRGANRVTLARNTAALAADSNQKL